MEVSCKVELIELTNDDGEAVESVRVSCRRCGHQVDSYGTRGGSVRRSCAILRDCCPELEDNVYRADPKRKWRS